jgi:hypothetical protein
MRIIIDVDGDNVSVTTEPVRNLGGYETHGAIGRREGPRSPEPVRTAGLGAHDAGPVPPHLAGPVTSAINSRRNVPAQTSDAGAARLPRNKSATHNASRRKKG